jgi:hypothetical protein
MTIITDPAILQQEAESKRDANRAKAVAEATSKDGLRDRMLKWGTGVLESPLVQTLGNMVQRWDSARAVFLGAPSDKKHPVATELLGGTGLGEKMGLDEPTRAGFDDLLASAGIPEGPDLETLLGDNAEWLTTYVNPTSRGMLAFGTNIASDPFTWVTPVGPGAAANQVVGKAGAVNLTTKGAELVENVYKSGVTKIAREMGEDVASVAKMSTDEFIDLEVKVLQHQRDAMGMKGLGEAGLGHAQTRLMDDAGRRVADRLGREGTKGLTYESGLRVFDTTWLGGKSRGLTLIPQKPILEGLGRLRSAIASGSPKPIINNVEKVIDQLDRTFNRLPKAVRGNKLFRQMEQQRFVTRNSGSAVVDEHLGTIFNKQLRRFETDKEGGKILMHYIEQPKKYDAALVEYFGDDAEMVRGIAERWISLADGMGDAAVKMQFLENDQYIKYAGRYIPHQIKDISDDLADQIFTTAHGPQQKIGQEFKGGSIFGYGRERHAPTLSQLRAALKSRGHNPDDVINYNPVEVMSDYIKTHVAGVADANFANDLVAEFSPTFQTVLRNLAPDTIGLAARVTDEQLGTMQKALSRAKTVKDTPLFHPEYKKALKDIEGFDPVTRAAYLQEKLTRIEGPEGFAEFLKDHSKIIDKVSNKDLSNLREFNRTGAHKVDGRYVVEHAFTDGNMKGQTRLIPAHMKEFFEEESTRLGRGLTKPEENALKMFDLITNTFKVTHTVFALKFHNRNAMSNLASIAATFALTPMMNPARVWRTLRVMNGAGDFTVKTAAGKTYVRSQLTRLHNANDILPKRVQIAETTGARSTLLQKRPATWFGLDRAERWAGKLGQANENFARGMYFQTLLERGYIPRRASELVKEALFDYSDLSKFEQNVFKRAYPFYTWTRKNIELQARNITQRPAATMTQFRALNNFERGPAADTLPEYMNGDLKVQLKAGPGKALFITNIDMPIQNVNVLWNGGVRETLKLNYGMVNAFVKAPQEYALGIDGFTGRNITGQQFMGALGPQVEATWPKPLKDYIKLEPVTTSDGNVLYKSDALRLWLIMSNVVVGRMARDITEAAATAKELGSGDRPEGARMLVKMLTGLNVMHIDMDEARKAQVKRSIRWLEDEAAKKGLGYKFDIFVPNKGNGND